MQPSLFSTIGSDALPGLWLGPGEVNPDNVLKYFDFSTRELAQAYGVRPSALPPTDHLPDEIRQRLHEWALILQDVAAFFDGNPEKTMLWFQTPNPLLGGFQPRQMIQIGRASELHQIVRETIAGHLP